jgi:hypothetical protein
MSRDINRIIPNVVASQQEIHNKDVVSLQSEISSLKKSVENIESKLDLALELLNTFIVLIEEDEEEESYLGIDDENTWVPEESSYEDDADDEWNSHEDDS